MHMLHAPCMRAGSAFHVLCCVLMPVTVMCHPLLLPSLARPHCSCSALAFAPRQQGLVLAVGYSSSPAAAARLGSSLGSSSSVLLFEAAGVVRQQLQWTLLGKIQVC